jgi:hypothetical protein
MLNRLIIVERARIAGAKCGLAATFCTSRNDVALNQPGMMRWQLGNQPTARVQILFAL